MNSDNNMNSDNKKTVRSQKNMKRLMRGLLAGTCLTAASAYAGTVNEPPDFSNTLAGAVASPLLTGTSIVTGDASIFDDDFFDFAGLLPGGAFTLSFVANANGVLNFEVFNTSGVHLGTPAGQANAVTSVTFSGTVPGDGQLVAFAGHSEGSTYMATLTAAQASAATPEPASAALAGLGLATAGLPGARRRRK